MMGMLFVNIFDSKVVHYETESDWSPFMAPEARGGELVILSCSVDAFCEYIIGKLSILGKTIDNFPNFEIYPPPLYKITEVVFVDEFFRDVGEADTCIFTMIKRISEVKVFYVEGEKLVPLSERTLLMRSFKSFIEPVGVPTSLG